VLEEAMSTTPLLAASSAGKTFMSGSTIRGGGRVVALKEFWLEVDEERPAFIGLVGESGSGKTTACRLLLNFISPSEGTVAYRGTDLRLLDAAGRHRFRREVQAVFQDPFETFNPFYRVNHCLVAAVRGFRLARSKQEEVRLIESSLAATGLDPAEVLGRYPHELSGGQRQRVMVARALLVGPRAVIADEPVSMIDASMRASVLSVFRDLHETRRISFVYITHDLTTARQVCRHLLVLYRGITVEAGPADDVIDRPNHPYTQELIASIPDPEPSGNWLSAPAVVSGEEDSPAGSGCPYLPRCGRALERCRREAPPRFRSHRSVVACWLYEGGGIAEKDAVCAILRARATGGGR